jgi:predicted ATPase
MQIVKFQLQNYKSYNEPVSMEFGSGISVITGQNNAGKTALLEALSFQYKAIPHRSVKTIPKRTSPQAETTRIEVTFRISNDELRDFFISQRGSNISIPIPALKTPFATSIGYESHHWDNIQRLLAWLLSQSTHDVSLLMKKEMSAQQAWSAAAVPSIGGYPPERNGDQALARQVVVEFDGTLHFTDGQNQPSITPERDLGAVAAPFLIKHIYFFKAERPNIGLSKFGGSELLAADAGNLPEVLFGLRANYPRFERFDTLVHEVFPHIGRIEVRKASVGEEMLEIVVGPQDRSLERPDLSIPLANSGTGLGQVLAILYVVVNSDNPQTVIIDEPNSFLHPGAARKLVEILKRYPQHQFIVSTHSPTIITAAQPDSIVLITHTGSESNLERLDAKEAGNLRRYLDEIGASLSDVFGADGILWVEGMTEEKCYALIIEKLLKKSLMGKVVKAVIATGDFEGKHAERFFEIYNKLSGAQSLLPPAVSFLFDDEGRTPEQKKVLESLGGGRVRFTQRRMFENYLLEPPAIVEVLNATDGHTQEVTLDQVQGFITSALEQAKYFKPLDRTRGIHGTKADVILKDLFFSLAGLDYRKTVHSAELTEWLIANSPETLSEIAAMVDLGLGP